MWFYWIWMLLWFTFRIIISLPFGFVCFDRPLTVVNFWMKRCLVISNISKKLRLQFPAMLISMVRILLVICLWRFGFGSNSNRRTHQTFISFAGTTFYNIHVAIGTVNWTVRHRFKEFVDLHSKLVNGQSIGRDLLPPKKVNKSDIFCMFDVWNTLISW